MGDQPPHRPGRFEILGAWLRIWTPPRDVIIPPVPWRRIAVGGLVLAAALGTAAALVLPRVAEDREQARERDQRAEARRHAAFLASVDREQAPRRGRGQRDPGAGTPAARRTGARNALVASAASGIEVDARRRSAKPVRGVDCEPFPRVAGDAAPAADLSRPAAAYDCVAVTSRFGGGSGGGAAGVLGIPFRLVADFGRGRFAWCRIVPLGDRDRLSHPLPADCRLRPPGE
ncbi:MAG: hypothetical protein WD844_16805 [Thermoleophilaceae bacterium]